MEYYFEKPVGTKRFQNFFNFSKIQSHIHRALFHTKFPLRQLFLLKLAATEG